MTRKYKRKEHAMRQKMSAVVALAATIAMSIQGCDLKLSITATTTPTPTAKPVASSTPAQGLIDFVIDHEDSPTPKPTRNPALFDSPIGALLPTPTPIPTPTPTPRFPLWTKKGDLGFPYEFPEAPAGFEYFSGGEWQGAHYFDASRNTYYAEPAIRRDTVNGVALDRKSGKVVVQINRQDLGAFPEMDAFMEPGLPPLLSIEEAGNSSNDKHRSLLDKTAILFTLGETALSFLQPARREHHQYGNSAVRVYAPYEYYNLTKALNGTKTVTSYDRRSRVLTLAPGIMDVPEATIESGILTTYHIKTPFESLGWDLDAELYKVDSLFAHDQDKLFFFRSPGVLRPDTNTVVWGKVRTRVDGKKELRLTQETKVNLAYFRVLSAALAGGKFYLHGLYQTVPCSSYMEGQPAWNTTISACSVPMVVRFPETLITNPPVATESLK